MNVRTLIVEDNVAYRESLRGILCARLPGAAIAEAGNGKEALRQIAAAEPDFILMDISLPGENGLRLSRKIKAAYPHIVIIMITNHDLPEYRRAAIDSGASYFIPKGKPIEHVLAVIESVRAAGTPPLQ